MLTYEDKLNRDLQWALREGGMHFQNANAVHDTLRRLAGELEKRGIQYAVIGAMAMFFHGYRRFTEDVDILVTADGWRRIHTELVDHACIVDSKNARNLRDVETGVRIELYIAGDFPGDGKPKPVRLPDPSDATVLIDGVRCLTLQKLIELKIAAGSASWRLKDLADAQEMISVLSLPFELREKLHESIRDKYAELWDDARQFISQDQL